MFDDKECGNSSMPGKKIRGGFVALCQLSRVLSAAPQTGRSLRNTMNYELLFTKE